MDDPLSRALEAAPEGQTEQPHAEVARYRTPHAPVLGEVMNGLREQLVDAMALPFFDGGTSVEMTPVVKHVLAETSTAAIVARKRAPAFEARVSIEVRCDHDAVQKNDSDGGRYEVRAHARLRCDDARGRREREFAVTVREIDGCLQLDRASLREEMAAAIRAIGKAP